MPAISVSLNACFMVVLPVELTFRARPECIPDMTGGPVGFGSRSVESTGLRHLRAGAILTGGAVIRKPRIRRHGRVRFPTAVPRQAGRTTGSDHLGRITWVGSTWPETC